MREILFRGKRVDNGNWVYGCLLNNIYGASKPIIVNDAEYTDDNRIAFDFEFIDQSTIGQCTGLTDKNGKKVFEGDIVKIHHKFFHATEQYSFDLNKCEESDYFAAVTYKDSGFMLVDLAGVRRSIYIDDLCGFKNGTLSLGNAIYQFTTDRFGWHYKEETEAIAIVGNIHDSDIDKLQDEINLETDKLNFKGDQV